VYKVIDIGDAVIRHAFTPVMNMECELIQVILKHRRFTYRCETPEETKESRGWHLKFNENIIGHRIYEAGARLPMIEDSGRRIFRLPCLAPEKQHEIWLITPGADALFFFFGGGASEAWKIDECFIDVICRFPCVTLDGNDLLINGGKAGGFDTAYNADTRTRTVTAGITYDATAGRRYEKTFDFSKKKYTRLAGFNETGISRAEFDDTIAELYERLKCL
jgi:hypothetical protein